MLDRKQGAEVGIKKDNLASKFEKEDEPKNSTGVNASVEAKETRKYIYEALTYLDEILPDSDCYDEATILLNEIKSYVNDEEFFENRQKYEDAKNLEAMKLQTISDIANRSLELDMIELKERRRDATIHILR